jgi:pyridoxamine 5'-phosphate oxidase family protein
VPLRDAGEDGLHETGQVDQPEGVELGNTQVALVVDDLASAQPWTPRYLRVYGTAELVERQGQFGTAPYMRITPTISWSFNLEGTPFSHDREVRVSAHRAPSPGRGRGVRRQP